MDERWRETFRAWAEQPQYRQLLRTTQAQIATALLHSQRPYVAYSGGKDSTVLLHLVLRQRPNVLVLHWDYGRAFIPLPLHQEIVANARRIGARELRIETSSAYQRLGRRATNVLGRHMFGRLLPRLQAEGYDLAFVGLRREESYKRNRRVRAGRSLGPIPECWPLADWRWLDVLAYISEHNLPLLSLYHTRAALVGWDKVRFTTLFDLEFAHIGADTIDNVLHWRWRHAHE